MGRALLILSSDAIREKAKAWVDKAPPLSRVTFQGPKRTLPQNDHLWLWLTRIAEQLEWHGQRYSAEDWKDYLLHSLKRARWMPDEQGGMVPIGMRSSDLSKEEFSEFLELVMAFAASHGVEDK